MDDSKKRLIRAVNVDGEWYKPGDDVPTEVAERITNPKAWTSEAPTEGAGERRQATEPGTASGARLARTVHVDGASYGPDDHVPDAIAAKIRNPKAWAGGAAPGDSKAKAANTADAEDTGDDTKTPADGGGEGAAPKAARKAAQAKRA